MLSAYINLRGGVIIKRYKKVKPNKKKDDHIINERIKSKQVMAITDEGEKLGVISKNEAINRAFEKGMDLVLVAPNAKPPVAKFMDYNKYKYEQQKKQREARKNQKTVTLKELRLSPKIEEHDFNTKLRKGRDFLERGDKLKLSIRFRGREMAFTDQGRDKMLEFAEKCKDIAKVKTTPKRDGRNMHMILVPDKDNK
ncbi:MAG: translation initiation factor IF-3 [Candidatus Izimaplasma sp.]|nr:translation initiation factor IF-3 [Candidatus Izimaplasma bacterium]